MKRLNVLQLSWSIAQASSLAGESLGLVLYRKPGREEPLGLLVRPGPPGERYALEILKPERARRAFDVWRMLEKSELDLLIISRKGKPVNERSLEISMVLKGIIDAPPEVRHVYEKEAESGRGARRKRFGLASLLPFGKHKGRSVKEVVDSSPDYIKWALENISKEFLDEPARAYYEARQLESASIETSEPAPEKKKPSQRTTPAPAPANFRRQAEW